MDEILRKLKLARKNLEILNSASPDKPKKLTAIKTKPKPKDSPTNEISLATPRSEVNILEKAKLINENIQQLMKISESVKLKKLQNTQAVIKEDWSPKSQTIEPLDPANTELIRLASLSGAYEFQTIQIIGNTIPEIWCPEVRSKVDAKDLPVIPVNRGGTGATDVISSRNNLGLGTLSTQNSNSVAITGGEITVNGQFNTGVSLSANSYSTAKMSIRSPIIDFTIAGEVQLFTVPIGYFFLIDEMEVITISISSSGEPPLFTFGNTSSSNAYYGPGLCKSNSAEFRHVIQSPQNGAVENTTVTFNIQEASTAGVHTGVGIINGYLISAI
jgi:hypothetical protein